MSIYSIKKGAFSISTDQAKLDYTTIHSYLKDAYWCKNIPMEIVQKSIKGSLCFGVYHRDKQVGFARVVSDFATFAYLADVFILPNYQGQGLGKFLIQTIMDYPDLQEIRTFSLATKDAHGLYTQFGFKPLAEPEKRMLKVYRTEY
ncbi:MAG: GNAT family N-acetyltransferase [Bacteroidota bacterium]